ncbi:hypothetical protein, partial [Cronobacter sakazakii]|uniref:hypothetical protein n=1 Tax=Cronobacter sakazakii TaxID=28141 RepID=UPI0020CA9CA2
KILPLVAQRLIHRLTGACLSVFHAKRVAPDAVFGLYIFILLHKKSYGVCGLYLELKNPLFF